MGPRWCPAAFRRALASGERRKWRRSWLLVLAIFFCSPVLLPLACLSFPLLCVAGLCLRAGRKWRRRRGAAASMTILLPPQEMEARLLQRYLEDQLRLVVGGLIIDSAAIGNGGIGD